MPDELIWESDDSLASLYRTPEDYRLRVDREGIAAVSYRVNRDQLRALYEAIGVELAR